MRVILIAFSICLVCVYAQNTLTDAQRARLREYREACIKETGADAGEVDRAQRGDWANNEKLRCFAACLMKKLGLMNDEGRLDEAATRAKLAQRHSPEKVEEIMKKCKDLRGANTCETGYVLLKCYTDNNGGPLV